MRGPERYAEGRPSWVDLATTDLAAAKMFYTALFGWDYRQAEPEGSGYYYALIDGHAVAGLSQGQRADLQPRWTVYLAADSADAAAQRAQAAGASVLVEAMTVGPAGRMAYLADPVGANFGLWEGDGHKGAGLINHPGAFSWAELHAGETEAAAAFYNAAFGLAAEAMDFEDGSPPYVLFKIGDAAVAGTSPPPGGESAKRWHVYFGAEDVDDCVGRVAGLGGVVVGGPLDTPMGRVATLADPQGASFSVIAMNEWPQ